MASPIPAGSLTHLGDVRVPDVYRAYVAFSELASSMGAADLAHRLVLGAPLSVAGEAPMIAASIASASTLCIEPDLSALRHSIRSGAIDFTVNSLDEALRALKNEVRKGTSIAVCLEGDPQEISAEMVERGVQPDVVSISAAPGEQSAAFVARGARQFDPASPLKTAALPSVLWRVNELPGKWLPLLDALAAAILPEDDRVRRTWLRRSPRYLGRAARMERTLPMTTSECVRFGEALEKSIESGALATVITLQYEGHTRTFSPNSNL